MKVRQYVLAIQPCDIEPYIVKYQIWGNGKLTVDDATTLSLDFLKEGRILSHPRKPKVYMERGIILWC